MNTSSVSKRILSEITLVVILLKGEAQAPPWVRHCKEHCEQGISIRVEIEQSPSKDFTINVNKFYTRRQLLLTAYIVYCVRQKVVLT